LLEGNQLQPELISDENDMAAFSALGTNHDNLTGSARSPRGECFAVFARETLRTRWRAMAFYRIYFSVPDMPKCSRDDFQF
jgi:hypothetical protein